MSAHLKDSIVQTLQQWQQWKLGLTSPPKVIRELGGRTEINQTCLLESGQWRGVLKINQAISLTFERNWDDELLATQMASELGLGPNLLHHNSEGNYLILEFITHQPSATASEIVRLLAEKLSLLHEQDLPLKTRDYSQEARRYLQQMVLFDSELCAEHSALFDQAIDSADELSDPLDHVVCHHDLSAENLLFDGDNIYFADWEYACRAHPLFDLVCCQNLILKDSHSRNELVKNYHAKRATELNPQALQHAQRLFQFYSLAWNLYLLHEQNRDSLGFEVAESLHQLQLLAN